VQTWQEYHSDNSYSMLLCEYKQQQQQQQPNNLVQLSSHNNHHTITLTNNILKSLRVIKAGVSIKFEVGSWFE